MTTTIPTSAEVVRDDQRGSKRLYRITFTAPDGTTRLTDLWSATTLLKGLPKDALVRWAANETAAAATADLPYWAAEVERWGAEEVAKRLAQSPWQKSGKKADIGTDVHHAIEESIKADTFDVPTSPEVAPYFRQFMEFTTRYKPEWEASELTVAHTEHKWAGTLDAIATINGRRLLLDFKTTKATKGGGAGIYLEHACQLAMYRHAELAVDNATGSVFPMPETEGAAVVWLAPDQYRLIEVKADGEMYRLARLAAEIWVATQQRWDFFMVGEVAA